MSYHHRPRFIALTPGIGGADGISELSRLVVGALVPLPAEPASDWIDVLSVTDSPAAGSDNRFSGVRLLGAEGYTFRFIVVALAAALRRAPYTAVLCLHLHLSPLAWLIAARGARLITVLVGIEAWKPLRRVQRQALKRSNILMAISHHTARRFREANPEFRDHAIHVCQPAARMRDRSDDQPEPLMASVRHEKAPFALIVGRMAAAERYKGHDLLIDIWPQVARECPDARLVVVGDGDDRCRLQTRASELEKHIVFRGRISDAELAQLYRDCTFFVMPSRDEGFGLVFLEAMRAGRACIGGLGAAAEVIEDGVTGLVVDPRDSEQVLKAVLRLFREPETRERMGRAGAARVAEHFTEMHFRQRFRALLGLAPEPV